MLTVDHVSGSEFAAVEAQLASLRLLLNSVPRKRAAPFPDKHPVVMRLLGCCVGCWQPLGLCVCMDQANGVELGGGGKGKAFAEHPVKFPRS